MRVLLDTHTFLWFILEDRRLVGSAQSIIEEMANEIEISPATYWEIAIKIRIGKYTLPEAYDTFIERQISVNDFLILPILPRHTSILTTLPMHHKDPFDRMLVAQALSEGIPIMSADEELDAYGITRLW